MKRFITSSTALALALAAINPAALRAQTEDAVCAQNGEVACGAGQQADVAPKKKKAAQQTEKAPKPEEQPAAEEVPKGRKKARPQQPAAEAQQERSLSAAPEPEGQPTSGGKAGAAKAASKGKVRKSGGAAVVPAEGQPVTPTDEVAQDSGRNPAIVEVPVASAGKAAPTPEAAMALDQILAEDAPARPKGKTTAERTDAGATPRKQGKPKRPAAAEAGGGAGEVQVTETRVTESDARRADREPGDQPDAAGQGLPTSPEDKTAAKKGGLSDLEKAGLVVLGALAVGAILQNGNRVVSNTGDRVIVDRGDGDYVVWKDDDALLRQPGNEVRTETFSDGSTRSTVHRPDGTEIVTIRDASGRVLRRARVNLDGSQTLLIDDLSEQVQQVDVSRLPKPLPGGLVVSASQQDAALRAALLGQQVGAAGRAFSLAQIRDYREVRALAPTVNVESITFPTGSSVIGPSEARKLTALGRFMVGMIAANPAEMFLIEGHTDAVGSAAMNLALSDRRAESVALALTEYFGVAPENMVVQGYGESELLIDTVLAEPMNRRAAVRMISPLMQQVRASN
ncbi:MAG: OmpA family protein [Gemmobacter sp.]|jgi:outer membrane protein OmpA-like peptidoglycan-associated protein|nr:OmpA family protein [Gemmobacter sp.]